MFNQSSQIVYAEERSQDVVLDETSDVYSRTIEGTNDTVYFYVAKIDSQNGKNTTVGNNDFVFLKNFDGVLGTERILISFGKKTRTNYDVFDANNNPILSTAKISQFSIDLKCNGEQLSLSETIGDPNYTESNKSFVKQETDEGGINTYYEYTAILDVNALGKEGKFEVVFGDCTFQTTGKSETISNIPTFSFYAFKNATYNVGNYPNATISGANEVTSSNVEYYREFFYNYQNFSETRQILPTITFDPHHFRLSISKTFQGTATNYSFSVQNGEVVQTVTPASKDPLGYDYVLNEITLKDLGVYSISYTYIYNYDSQEVEMSNINKFVKRDTVSIFGYQAMYSAYDAVNPVELRSSSKELSFDGTNWVYDGTIVNLDFQNKSTKIGNVQYNIFFKKGCKVRAGTLDVVYDGSEWKVDTTDVDLDFVSKKATIGGEEREFDFTTETRLFCDTYSASTNTTPTDSLNSDKAPSTNQGPVYLLFNSSVVAGLNKSCYYYRAVGSSTWGASQALINNFEKAGEYFVKVTYTFSGYKEQVGGAKPLNEHTQYFYFKLTNETPSIDVFANNSDGTRSKLYDGEYTNCNVTISKPIATEFNSVIEVVVKSALYSSSTYTKTHSSSVPLTEGAKYQVQVKYGKRLAKSQFTYFVIDKTPINQTYLYATQISQQTGTYVIDSKTKNDITTKSYTNSNFVLQWANKQSGAKITTYYNFYPLVKGSITSMPVTSSIYSVTESWVSSDYYLDYDKTNQIKISYANTYYSTLSSASVLTEQGLYLFKLVDEAGWEKEVYMLIDKTDARVLQRKTDGTYQLPTTLNHVSEDMNLVFGTHKEISFLNIEGTGSLHGSTPSANTGNKMFDNYLISERDKGNLKPSNSYSLTHSFVVPIKKIVQKSVNTQTYKVIADGLAGISLAKSELLLSLFDTNGNLNEDYYEYFIVDGSNFDLASFSGISTTLSQYSGFHSIRLTTDLSGSIVLIDNENVSSSSEVKPISIMKKQDEENAGLTTLRFTTSDKIYFAYRDSSDFDVESVSCQFYALEFNPINRSYQYAVSPTDILLNFTDASSLLGESGYLIATVNGVVGVNGLTKAGKYVISRTYSTESATYVSGKNDYMKRVFVCFVDRNSIVSIPSYQNVDGQQVEMKVVGEYLNLNVLDGKTGQVSFNNFYMQNQNNVDKQFLFSMDSIIFTNKSPVKLYVPISKYGWFIDDVFSYSGVGADIVAGYASNVAYYTFHKDLLLSLKVISAKNETYISNVVDANGYLTLSFTTPGKYVAVVEDGMGFAWHFAFTIISATPEITLNAVYVDIDEHQNETTLSTAEIGENKLFTNADKIMVTYTDPADEYMAKIDKDNIYYTVNQNLDSTLITNPSKTNPYKKVNPNFYENLTRNQSFNIPELLNDGDVLRIYVQFEGDIANYPADKFFLIKTISIDQTAPNVNLSNLASSQILEQTRVEGRRYNKTSITSANYPNYAYPMNADFAFSRATSENSTDTSEIYYKIVTNKYTSSIPEVVVPTDPSALTNPPPANLFVSSSYTPLSALSNYFSYSVSVSGLYEIVEKDVAGNYTVFLVYYFAPINDEITINYTTEGEVKTADLSTLVDAELTAYNSFAINSLSCNSDPWWNLTIRDEKNNNWSFRKTPFLTYSQLLDTNGSVVSFGELGKICGGVVGENAETGEKIFGFQNNSRYSFSITNRVRGNNLNFNVVVGDSGRKLDVVFTESSDGLSVSVSKDTKDIVKLKTITAELVKKQQDGTFVFTQSNIILHSDANANPLVYLVPAITGYDIVKISILTNFGAVNSYYYLPDSPTTQNELVGEDVFTDVTGMKVSSKNVEFYYNNVIYDVTVVVRNAVEGVKYFTSTKTGKITKIVLLAAPLTYGNTEYVGAERYFELHVTSNITEEGDEDVDVQNIVVKIDNLLPQVNLFDDYSNLKNSIFGANAITKNAVSLRFVENDDYIVVLKNLTNQTETIITSNTRVESVGEYQIIVKFAETFVAQYTKYFSITANALSLYAVTGKNAVGDNPTFLSPSANYYTYNNSNIKYYISSYLILEVVVDDDLSITKTLISESVSDQTTTQIWHIYNTSAVNQSIYIDEYIALTYVPATTNVISKFQRSAISASSGINWTDIKSDILHKIVLTETSTSVENVTLKWDEYHLIEGNKILVDYYFNSKLVFENMQISSIELKTSGKHTFVFHDMAGNYHFFTKGIESTSSYDVFFVKSVVFEINGETPINYAVYDSQVEISIPENTLSFYNQSSPPKIMVLRNGEEYEVTTVLRTTTISESGFYEVWFEAGPEGDRVLVDPIYFTIIDSFETRWAFEYDKYENYQIVSVKKNNTELLTEPVRSLFVSIDDDATGVGKYDVLVKVVRNDSLLPVQWFDFSFWINDGVPPIIVSAEQGVETIPTITVSFNVKNMYSELGNCYVKITGMEKIIIDESTIDNIDEVQNIEIKKQGNYFIQVYTSNGNLVYSYRVVKRDPLNGVAIAMIVLGSVLLVAVVAVFFKLRKRTRIR